VTFGVENTALRSRALASIETVGAKDAAIQAAGDHHFARNDIALDIAAGGDNQSEGSDAGLSPGQKSQASPLDFEHPPQSRTSGPRKEGGASASCGKVLLLGTSERWVILSMNSPASSQQPNPPGDHVRKKRQSKHFLFPHAFCSARELPCDALLGRGRGRGAPAM